MSPHKKSIELAKRGSWRSSSSNVPCKVRRSRRLFKAFETKTSPPTGAVSVTKVEAKKEDTTNVVKRNKIENMKWLMSNIDSVAKKDLKDVLSSTSRAARFGRQLVERLETAKALEADFVVPTLVVLNKLLALVKGLHLSRSIFYGSILQAGIFDQLISAMEANEAVAALQASAVKALCAITKDAPDRLGEPRCVAVVLKAMTAHSSNFDVQLPACQMFLHYTSSKMEHGIHGMIVTTDCLEILAAAPQKLTGNHKYTISVVTQQVLKKMSAYFLRRGRKMFPSWEPPSHVPGSKHAPEVPRFQRHTKQHKKKDHGNLYTIYEDYFNPYNSDSVAFETSF